MDRDGDFTLDQARKLRAEARTQLFARGFVICDPDAYYTANIHAVSTPFQPRDLHQPVVFTCGAMPADLSVARMEDEVGPALRDAVRRLEEHMGMPPAPLPG